METNIGKLGFGLMRLPQIGEEIDIEQVKQMVDLFMEKGFNYFDTAYGYGNGASERAAKAAIVERYPRDSFYLATKLPAFMAKNKEEAEQMFYTSLERTGAGYFDFYLMHNLGATRTQVFTDYDMWNFVQEKKKEGLIRHIGFSMHDNAESLDKVLTEHPEMEFVQLQINFADWEDPGVQARKCYEVARKHNKPIIVMEPVKGGTLNSMPPQACEPLKKVHPDKSIASWAIRYVAGMEGILTVLSGMSNMEQMQDNLSYMENFQPLNDTEKAALEEARDILASIPIVPCTGCDYCAKDCPKHVAISGAFEAFNLYKIYNSVEIAKDSYKWPLISRGLARAQECIGCGRCERVCPQKIHIIEELKNAAEVLDK